jgi:hypothetical protein
MPYVNMIRAVSIVVLAVALCGVVRGQESETRKEVWSELGVFVPLDEKYRLYFLVTGNRAEETRKVLKRR